MAKLLQKYNKNPKPIDIENKRISLLDLTTPPHDNEFLKTSVMDLYKKYNIPSTNLPNSGNLLSRYYNEYGYTSLIAEAGSYLLGVKNATGLLQSGLSTLIPGATRGGITSVVLSAANIALRNPFIESTINNLLPSPNLLNIPDSRLLFQSIPPTVFLSTNPPIIGPNNTSSNLVSATIQAIGISTLLPTISGVANTGTLTNYDLKRAFGNSINAAEIIILSQQGLKYTKPVAWFDSTKPKWSNRLGNYFTYDKYIAYGNDLTYSKIRELYKDTLEDRYNNWSSFNYNNPNSPSGLIAQGGISNPPTPSNAIPSLASPISNIINNNNANNLSLYQQSLGHQTDPYRNPEEKYTNKPNIREKINKLGFPQYNKTDAKQINQIDDSRDKINMLDVGEDYNENLRDTIKFKIYDIFNKEPIIFRAVLDGISDTFSPSWQGKRYLGRADSFYTYEGTDRKISFGITVYAQSKDEVVSQWRKINRIAGLCYPTEYKEDTAMRGPIVQLTIGDLYNDIYGHFSNLSISPVDNTMWDIDDGYQLPQVVKLAIDFAYMYGIATPQTKIAHFVHSKTKFDISPNNTKNNNAQQALPITGP